MNRAAFFHHLTVTDPSLFPDGMSDAQRAGLNTKLDVWARWYAGKEPLVFLAAALGQIHRETGGRMEPVLEAFAPDRKESARRLASAYEAGRLTWVKTPYWDADETGCHPVGGGDIQLTHRRNYVRAEERLAARFGVRVPLSRDYDLILDPVISAHVAFAGMIEGWFREPKLADFLGPAGLDYAAARDVVNGDGRHIGEEIQHNCEVYEAALLAAGADWNFGRPEGRVGWPRGARRLPSHWIAAFFQWLVGRR